MKKPIRIAIVVVALGLAGVILANDLMTPEYAKRLYEDPPAGAETVIFVGNSHTSRNHLPNMVERIADADERHGPIWVQAHAPGGWTLAQHVFHGGAEHAMGGHDVDYAVFQGNSVGPLVWPDEYLESFDELAQMAVENDVRPILYQVWPRHPERDAWETYDAPETPDDIDSAFAEIEEVTAEAIDGSSATLAAVGRAWEKVRLSDSFIDLYADDGNHANEAGTYLAALVIYGTIRGSELPAEPWHPSSMEGETAAVLRGAAEAVLAQ